MSDNPFFDKVEKARRHMDKLTLKQQGFINDLHRLGAGFHMTDKQHRWLGGIMFSLDKKLAKENNSGNQ